MKEDFTQAVMRKLDDIKRATLLGVKDTLTIEECALLTGYTTKTLYTFTSKRTIPYFKRGNSVHFSKAAVEKWMRGTYVPTEKEISHEGTTYTAINKQK